MVVKEVMLMSNQQHAHSGKRSGDVLKKILMILAIVVLAAILFGIVSCVAVPAMVQSGVQKQLDALVTKQATLTSETLMSTLESSSELVTSKMTMMGCVEYDDEGVPVLTKGDFVMIYKATVKAGVNVKEIKSAIDNTERVVYIYVPNAEVLDVKVIPDSVKYYDKSFVLFNKDSMEDSLKAQQQAEEDAKTEALGTGILEVADKQSETLVKGILQGVTEGYEMKFMRTLESINNKAAEIEANQATKDNAQ